MAINQGGFDSYGDFLRQIQDYSSQKEATTGRPMTRQQMEGVTNAWLNSKFTTDQARRQQQFQESMQMMGLQNQKDQMAAAQKSSMAQGLGGAATTGLGVYGLGKHFGWWGKDKPPVSPAGSAAPGQPVTPESTMYAAPEGTATEAMQAAIPGGFPIPEPGTSAEIAQMIGGPMASLPTDAGAAAITAIQPAAETTMASMIAPAATEALAPAAATLAAPAAEAGALGAEGLGVLAPEMIPALATTLGPVGPLLAGGTFAAGLVQRLIDNDCIIVTCASGREDDIDIARRFRDAYMSDEAKRGYYMIAEPVCVAMADNPDLKQEVDETFVKPLVEFGKFVLGLPATITGEIVDKTLSFLAWCEMVGKTVPSYRRCNGEVV